MLWYKYKWCVDFCGQISDVCRYFSVCIKYKWIYPFKRSVKTTYCNFSEAEELIEQPRPVFINRLLREVVQMSFWNECCDWNTRDARILKLTLDLWSARAGGLVNKHAGAKLFAFDGFTYKHIVSLLEEYSVLSHQTWQKGSVQVATIAYVYSAAHKTLKTVPYKNGS